MAGLVATLSMVSMTFAAMAAAYAAGAAAPAFSTAVVEQPRSFGHFLGDVLTQKILLDTDAANDPPQPPAPDRVGTWFERRKPSVDVAADGRRWLTIDYQIINAPAVLTTVTLPALTVVMKDGRPRRSPDWPIVLGPMTVSPEVTGADAHGLQPDRTISSLPTARIRLQLAVSAAVFASLLAAWTLWMVWRNRRDAETLPFAKAWRSLRRRGADARVEENWIALHRALNATAGRVIHSGSLPRFLDERPALQPLRSELEEFYRQSSDRFFSPAPSAASLSLLDLCNKLRRIEKSGATGA